jgi:hypothetical protein
MNICSKMLIRSIVFCFIALLECNMVLAEKPMTIYSRLLMRGPDESPDSLPWIYGPEQIDKKYGFKTLHVYFCKDLPDGSMDMADVDRWLNNLAAIPPSCYCMINREADPWWPYDNEHGGPRQDVIAKRCRLMRYFRKKRPDVSFGYFSCVPLASHWLELGDAKLENQAFLMDQALKPIADESSCLFPSFYMESTLSTDEITSWIHKSLTRAKTLYPDKQIIPILWPHWYDVWRQKAAAYDSPDFDWTKKELKKIRVPGPVWAMALQAIRDCDIYDVAIWMQGYPPFDADAEWFQETLKASKKQLPKEENKKK